MTDLNKISKRIEGIIISTPLSVKEPLHKSAAKSIATWLLECVPEDKMVQVGDSDNGFYRTRGEICIHGINLTRGDRLCLECATDKGWNAFRAEMLKRLTGE